MEGQSKDNFVSNSNNTAESQHPTPATSQSQTKDGETTQTTPSEQTPATSQSQANNGVTTETPTAEPDPQTRPPAPKFEAHLRAKGVTVLVKVGSGDKEYPFYIHKSLLCATSEFFSKAFNGEFSESVQGVASLPKEDPEVFALYVNFLYEKKLLPKGHDASFGPGGNGWRLLIKAWILGDYIQDVHFKDVTIDLMMLKIKSLIGGLAYFPSLYDANLAYRHTVHGSVLRRLVVDQFAWHGSSISFSTYNASLLNCEFLYDLTVALLDVRKLPAQNNAPENQQNTCRYHAHEEGKNCYKLA